MNRHPQSRAPLIGAIVLLLLPMLYVGSYLALVMPEGQVIYESEILESLGYGTATDIHYRAGGALAGRFFWPLEQVDRRVRPGAWDQLAPLQKTDSTGGHPGAQT